MKYKLYRFSDYSIEVIHNPVNNLPRSLQDELVEECTELSKDGFENPNIKKEFVRHCILDSSTVLFGRDNEGRLFGYSSNSIEFIEKYYIINLKSTIILGRFQGKGLRYLLYSVKMLEESNQIKKLGINPNHILLAGRTQNPLVFQYTARYLGLFPQPGRIIDQTIRTIGKKFVHYLYERHQDEGSRQILFDDRFFVQRGAYKSVTQTSVHGVYPSGIPYCHDDEINDYMNKHLDWQNGDALIVLGYYKDEIINQMFEDVKQRMGFCGVEEAELEKELANSYL